MNKKWVVIILSLALIMLIMPQNITAEDNSVNYDNLIIVSDDIVSEDGNILVQQYALRWRPTIIYHVSL